MNYVLLDLEWNSAYCKSEGKFVNEIIEIGAVKLDENLNEISSFDAIIRSQLTRRLRTHFKDLTNISNDEMAAGRPLKSIFEEYTKWAGKDTVTLTWSNSDLYALYENCLLFLKEKTVPCISVYADLQKHVQNELVRAGQEINSQIGLANAAERLGISTVGLELHRAIDDSRLCAQILRKVANLNALKALAIDTTDPTFYERLTYKAFIIKDIHSPLVDRKELNFKCKNCKRPAKKISKWEFHNGFFYANFVCENCHTKFCGKISFKKYYDKIVVKKYARPIKKERKEPLEHKEENAVNAL